MKTIALFGASGKSGNTFMKKALSEGYKLNCLVRNSAKIKIQHENLHLISGDVLDYTSIDETIRNSNLIVSLIGHVKNSPYNLQVKTVENIIIAMKKYKVNRIIDLTGAGVKDENDNPKFIDKLIVFIMKNLAGKAIYHRLMDGYNHVQLIKNSGLEWTIVRAPILTTNPEKGNYEVGYVGKINGITLTRDDLADFILNEIESPKWIGKMPYIANNS